MDGEKAEGMTVDERAKTRKEKALIECIGRVLSAQLKEKTELVQKISEILCRKVSGENVSEELSGYMRKYARLTFKADTTELDFLTINERLGGVNEDVFYEEVEEEQGFLMVEIKK